MPSFLTTCMGLHEKIDNILYMKTKPLPTNEMYLESLTDYVNEKI